MSTMSSRQSSAEKRAVASKPEVAGIVVPGIVLSERPSNPLIKVQAQSDNDETEPKSTVSSPQQVVLLAPGVVYPGRKGRAVRSIPQTARQLVCVALVALAFWHLWSTLDMAAMHVPITDAMS
ncbi:hypothetical protein CspeluHIS016_0104830 [Cutaneotrichosporon spelunceum]|uniref:Uncharacterized protein n=1 Tax=Cutaneotrichosporon spelunceum TaxID=1672016 RepID=A0AAD3TNM4_9TREE|nr:hypothetical protein CspeluHIS016_0104830 [Cutaneotrichosporon spelunceum]